MPTITDLESVPPAQCWSLLAGRRVGRLGLIVDGAPAIFPVNYVIDGESVLFRTGGDTVLNEAALRVVAFEVDDVDDPVSPWSVLLRGVGRPIGDAIDATSRRLRALDLPTAAPGERDSWFLIKPTSVSGRRIRVLPDAL